MGRRTKGVSLVGELDASAGARRRLQVILRLMSGEIEMAEASARLGLCASRIDVLRRRMLEGALKHLEPGRPGRPRKAADPGPDPLAAQVESLREELEIERVRTQIALTMPHLLKKGARKRR
jgi:hypothetical protein